MADEALVALPVNLDEYEAAARAHLPRASFDFAAGGSGDEATLRANRAAFARWRLLPRMLTGQDEAPLATTVLGQPVSFPVLVAPTGTQGQIHRDGELATAAAARAAGTIYTMSTAANYPMERISEVAGPWWFQLYILKDRALTRDLVARAEAAGAGALVVTVDVPKLGRREADERNGFRMADGLTMANLEATVHQAWATAGSGSGLAAYVASVWDHNIRWPDLDWLASITRLPVVPKGILHPEDAKLAVAHGAAAILVSNHGGRQLDNAVATLDALPDVAAAVGDQVEVYVDGGIRRGTDVLKALALGARAAFVGRPPLWGLAIAGEAGATRVLELLRAELELDLMLAGVRSVREVPRALLVRTEPDGTRQAVP